MTHAQRAATTSALITGVRRAALIGLRSRHPEADESELCVRLVVRLYGRDYAQRLFGDIPIDAI